MSVSVMANIDSERIRHGMTQEQLCEKLGITRKTYFLWKNKGDIPCSALVQLMDVFGCSSDYLLRDVKGSKN